jgi:Zn-finger nucleic acid-binding protein
MGLPMRVIVACGECKRQYDASGKRPDDRFHCHCGAELVVQAPRGHEAAVVRCSSCGAPREQQAPACTHCGADFTLHERDLHTVCPNCLARISDRAQFCHHCATRLNAESIAGESTDHHCPVCGQDHLLRSRQLGDHDLSVLECQKCAGLWFGLQTFEALLDAEAQRSTAGSVQQKALGAQQGPRYRPCVICGQLMVRRNFGRGQSGVVVDICGSHGIWFDSDELAQVIGWIRSGGLEAARMDMARLRSSTDTHRKRQLAREQRSADTKPQPLAYGSTPASPLPGEDDPLSDLFEAAIDMLTGLFRRF